MHPFDQRHKTDTSGVLNSPGLPGPSGAGGTFIYAGSQPSIVRTALGALPSLATFTFVDLGCGKGRPLLVASEFPFHDLLGVEMLPELVAAARKNAVIFQRNFPTRVPIRIEMGDAGTVPFPEGNMVVFLYNPFGEEVMKRVVARIEAALTEGNRHIFIVYYNPVHGACWDGSTALTRYFAAMLPYSDQERGYGPDFNDAVVIWQGGPSMPALPGADTLIDITKPGVRAELAGVSK